MFTGGGEEKGMPRSIEVGHIAVRWAIVGRAHLIDVQAEGNADFARRCDL
jgi:hypothetical protein